MIEPEEIEKLARGKPIEEVLNNFDWKDFEEIVAEIFRRHDFLVKKNFRLKAGRRREVDIIAARGNLVFCVDCKRWSGGRYKKSGIKRSVEEQEKRVRILEKNSILKKMLMVGDKPEIKPLLVTLMEEDLTEEKNTFIVPIFKLNSFLLEVENYL